MTSPTKPAPFSMVRIPADKYDSSTPFGSSSSKHDSNNSTEQTHPSLSTDQVDCNYESAVSAFPSHGNSSTSMFILQAMSSKKEFVCGWGSALINITVTFPINKLIFRQQLHGISSQGALKQLHKDGLRYLYRGLLPPLLQKTTSVSIMFGVYDKSRKTLEQSAPNLSRKTIILCSALVAGTLEASLAPFERVQTLMQNRNYHNNFANTYAAFRTLWQYGFTEYYRGLSVVILRNGPSNCFFFLGREFIKGADEPSVSASKKVAKDFVSGACLGAVISTFFFPFNVMKTHMQAQVGGPFVSIWSTFKNVLAERDGKVRHLFKGVHLNYTRSFISWGIINASYEILMNIFSRQESKSKSIIYNKSK